MTSEYREAFVWVWLKEETEPVVAGRLTLDGDRLVFNYGRSYLQRKNAIALFEPELPLKAGILEPDAGHEIHGCIRDASPDAWGRRVIINRLLGLKKGHIDTALLSELTYLLESGSDRVGALDFQRSAFDYVPRLSEGVSMAELLEAAERVEQGMSVPVELEQALYHGTSIGGARPKAQIEDQGKKYIAKFSSSSDLYSVVKAEYVAMKLASLVGIKVANVSLKSSAGKDVLLVERFDREASKSGWLRKHMVSALTLLGLNEMQARYASYEQLADLVRANFVNASDTLRELFGRITFNIICGNTDDHARNHAAFWDGNGYTLTPAYDICPQGRSGNIASQAMLIRGGQRQSQLSICLKSANAYLLSEQEAKDIIDFQIKTVESSWESVCSDAGLSSVDMRLLWKRAVLNPYILEGFSR
ncbi:type II toxin-antitoxin system HipA family toxin [Endozoicomonas numazuensis]|uniref:Phosphatidylinositol kinase n=1 Tax=Endozoicomonas numazuensis TaxID=1137799 RepID=A0A081NGQ5_9GAMM|nr:type II toxin-antitoxin system HipA family toxin [Endozoicomonas numazuensis]KEQ17628.1 phosphatidylinositol kinase [Endozoicomonas numazuensis]